eukprot:UN24535
MGDFDTNIITSENTDFKNIITSEKATNEKTNIQHEKFDGVMGDFDEKATNENKNTQNEILANLESRLSINLDDVKLALQDQQEISTSAIQDLLNEIRVLFKFKEKPDVSEELERKVEKDLQTTFSECDEDKDGYITLKEFKKAFEWSGVVLPEQTVEKIFNKQKD